MARGLQASQVDAIVMPCNTAHHFADDITAAIDIPFLNMVQLTSGDVAKKVPPRASVGILASPATQRIGLFQSALAQHGLTAVYPQNADAMLDVITTIKTAGPGPAQIATLQNEMDKLCREGVDAFIVGCSEFSLITQSLTATVPIIDALDVLTTAIINLRPSPDTTAA
jgi:aspartate racemase